MFVGAVLYENYAELGGGIPGDVASYVSTDFWEDGCLPIRVIAVTFDYALDHGAFADR
jgi:hypothetical protein